MGYISAGKAGPAQLYPVSGEGKFYAESQQKHNANILNYLVKKAEILRFSFNNSYSSLSEPHQFLSK